MPSRAGTGASPRPRHPLARPRPGRDGTFEQSSLDGVSQRDDALGQLARTFQRMAREVANREQRLRREVDQLRIEIDETRQAYAVAEITGSEYFQQLRHTAQELRRNLDQPPPATGDD